MKSELPEDGQVAYVAHDDHTWATWVDAARTERIREAWGLRIAAGCYASGVMAMVLLFLASLVLRLVLWWFGMADLEFWHLTTVVPSALMMLPSQVIIMFSVLARRSSQVSGLRMEATGLSIGSARQDSAHADALNKAVNKMPTQPLLRYVDVRQMGHTDTGLWIELDDGERIEQPVEAEPAEVRDLHDAIVPHWRAMRQTVSDDDDARRRAAQLQQLAQRR